MNFVFLAAGKSSRMFKSLNKPKCLLKLGKTTLIEKLILNLKNFKLKKIHVVVGFKSNLIKKSLNKFKFLNFVYNKNYESKEMLYSMMLALKKIDDDIIFSYSDIIYNKNIIKKLMNKKKNMHLPVLNKWQDVWRMRNKKILKDAENLQTDGSNFLIKIGGKIKVIKSVKFQFMGIVFIPRSIRKKIIAIYKSLKNSDKMHVTEFLNILIKKNIKIKCVKYNNHWYEFDDINDYLNYKRNN